VASGKKPCIPNITLSSSLSVKSADWKNKDVNTIAPIMKPDPPNKLAIRAEPDFDLANSKSEIKPWGLGGGANKADTRPHNEQNLASGNRGFWQSIQILGKAEPGSILFGKFGTIKPTRRGVSPIESQKYNRQL
jgi:hypothetical protein